MDNTWDESSYPPRSQSVSIPSSQFQSPSQPYPDDGQPHYDRRPSTYPPQLPPLQLNPATYHQSEPLHNLPSSSLPPVQHPGPPRTGADRHRAQSVALTAIGQREQRAYSSSSYGRMATPSYPPEATVPISRSRQQSQQQQQQQQQQPWSVQYPPEQLAEPPQVPYISSVMSPYAQPQPHHTQPHPHAHGLVPSRVMPPLSELDRRAHAPTEESAQPRPKPHACDQCGAAFSRAHDLKRHIETHKGDRPHKCPTCTKAFSRKDALQRHQSMAQCGVDQQEY